jgi:excisionase family DNA binding protein
LSLPALYTPEESAAKLRVTRRAVYTWLLSGKLKGFRAGQHWRISEEDLMEFMRREPLARTKDQGPSDT